MDSQIVAFSGLAALITITPGADTMMVLRNALRGGRSDGWTTAVGICSGLFVHAFFSAVGLSIVLAKSATAFHTVKLAGALYLVWLGIRSLRSAGTELATAGSAAPAPPRWQQSFIEGFLSNVLNPKVAIFYLALLPQFIGSHDHVLARSIGLALIHNIMGLVWLGAITVAIARGRERIMTTGFRRWLSRISGGVLIGLGLRLAVEKR